MYSSLVSATRPAHADRDVALTHTGIPYSRSRSSHPPASLASYSCVMLLTRCSASALMLRTRASCWLAAVDS